MVRVRPPRRAAAIQAHRQIVARRDRDGSIRQLGAAPPPRPSYQLPAPLVIHDCPLCQNPITEGDDMESCQSCHTRFHYDCTKDYHGPMDRQCRGLCGLHVINPNHNHNQPYLVNCLSCYLPFREESEDRWADVFNTQGWNRYIRRLRGRFMRMAPSIPITNPWHINNAPHNAHIPSTDWYLEQGNPATIPLERRIVDNNLLTYGGTWNQHNGPYHLHPGAWNWYRNNLVNNSFGNDLRGPRFIVAPCNPNMQENDLNQQYMFSELNYIMHSNRPAWKKFCKWFDDYNLPLANM